MLFQACLEDSLNGSSNSSLKNQDKVRGCSALKIYLAKASKTSFLMLSKVLEASWADLGTTSPLATTIILSLAEVTSISTTSNRISARTLDLSTMAKAIISQISGKEYKETCNSVRTPLKAQTKRISVSQQTRK